MKKIVTLVLIAALFISTLTRGVSAVAAELPTSKEEVVYGILNYDGTVNNLYVVNIFDSGTINDYGDYSELRNMTTGDQMNQSGDHITVQSNVDRFYYQGTLNSKELPWNIVIKYYLDEKEVSAAELAGKSGNLRITISVSQNSNVDRSFYENFALQIGLALDNKLCSEIEAENATMAEAGSKKQISYTVLPGNGIEASVSAKVHDFEMDAITINGIKLSLGIEVDTEEFTSQVSELTDAIQGLDDGADKLLDGLNQLSEGMQSYTEGMKPFKDGLGKLATGTGQLNAGAKSLKNGLSELTKQNPAILGGSTAILNSTFTAVNAQLGAMGLGLPTLTVDNYRAVLGSVPELASVLDQLNGVVQFTQGLKGYMDAVEQIKDGASELSVGMDKFDASASVIAASATQLYNGARDLNTGMSKVRDGLKEYKKGTLQLREGTSDMSSEIDTKVDEMLGSISGKGDMLSSFVSDKNTNISAVQFVIKTDTIKQSKVSEAEPEKTVKLTFWQKLLKLFGLYR
ncbi:MAG: hypothetical protein H6Q59_1520 [Firmicutes bacterium]|nr:hypothetical protein [Bacillota bacterium]